MCDRPDQGAKRRNSGGVAFDFIQGRICDALGPTYVVLLIFASCLVAHGDKTVTLAPHTFTIPDGFELQRVAQPPLVKRPVHLCFDVDGVLYVTDSSGDTRKATVQINDPRHRVLRLVDRDGDGVFDESTVFADKLPFPEGVLVYDGSVYVGAPPHIWKLRDTDGDHVADQRTVWFDGGSLGKCGNDMHGPYIGPDGFFYWTKGAFAGQTHELTNGRTRTSRAAHIYRARPDGSQLERVITGGMNNPVGLAFNATGDRFLSGTFFDMSQPGRRDGILHAIYGGVYGREHTRVLAPHPNSGGLLPVLKQLGPAAPSGIVMPQNRASLLQGDLVCTEFNTHRVSRHQLSSVGATWTAETTTLLQSDQSDFHPTDVIEDADGSLLVADTGSWYMICCPTSKIARPDVLGAIYRLQKKGRASTRDLRGQRLHWDQPEVSWLEDPRPAVVQRAIRVLATGSNIEALSKASARLPAVWALNRIPGPHARKTVRRFLADEDSSVQAAAIHSVALWRDRDALPELLRCLSLNDPQLKRLAAMALGRIGDNRAVRPLLDVWSGKSDPFLQHALIYALFEIGDIRSLPTGHPLEKRVQQMLEAERRNDSSSEYPEILAAEELRLTAEEVSQRRGRIEQLSEYLSKGDVDRGRRLFQNRDRAKCITCHLKGKEGVRLGPDLTSIGAVRSKRDLLEAIVYPSASIARYHEVVNVVTKNGEVAGGLIVKETEDEMSLSTAEEVVQTVPYRDIERARYSNVSLMPKGLDRVLKPEEIADLVAYLKAAQPASNTSGEKEKNK